jgi:hypothetical protein
MGLESGSFLDDLNVANPVGAVDKRKEGDDHLRLIKTVLKATFPGMAGRAWRVQQKAAGYTVIATDNMTLFECTAALTLAFTAAVSLGNGFMFLVKANGGDVVLAPNAAELINGESELTIPDGEAFIVFCDGDEFFAFWLLSPTTSFLPDSVLTAITNAGKDEWGFRIPDQGGVLLAGAGQYTFRAPFAATILDVRASVTGAASSGTLTFDINKTGVSILSTKLTIDASEKTSTTAATPAVLSSTTLDNNEEVTIDVDDDGAGDATEAKIYISVRRT